MNFLSMGVFSGAGLLIGLHLTSFLKKKGVVKDVPSGIVITIGCVLTGLAVGAGPC